MSAHTYLVSFRLLAWKENGFDNRLYGDCSICEVGIDAITSHMVPIVPSFMGGEVMPIDMTFLCSECRRKTKEKDLTRMLTSYKLPKKEEKEEKNQMITVSVSKTSFSFSPFPISDVSIEGEKEVKEPKLKKEKKLPVKTSWILDKKKEHKLPVSFSKWSLEQWHEFAESLGLIIVFEKRDAYQRICLRRLQELGLCETNIGHVWRIFKCSE